MTIKTATENTTFENPSTYNIEFMNADGEPDETQFDNIETAEELEAVYEDFCQENGINTDTAISVIQAEEERDEIEELVLERIELKSRTTQLREELDREQWNEHRIKVEKDIMNRIQLLEMEDYMIDNNIENLLFHEAIPQVLEVLEKYKNLLIGNKNEKRILQEVEDRTPYSIKFYEDPMHYGENKRQINGLSIYKKVDDKYVHSRVTTKKGTCIIDKNRIQNLSIDDFEVRDFIYDIPERIMKAEDVLRHKKAAELTVEKLNEKISEYNMELTKLKIKVS